MTESLLDIRNDAASARISLFGGQVLSFIPARDGRERLYLSPEARLDGSAAIRGGIPVCWPWFGAHGADPALPSHGFVRKRQWTLVERRDEAGQTHLVLGPASTSGEGFGGSAELFLHISVGPTLQLGLLTRNSGEQPFDYTCALHSYFAVSNIGACALTGLAGEYGDKNRSWAVLQTPAPYTFVEATDRVHRHASEEVVIVEGTTQTPVRSSGHDSIVVWNPWQAGAAALGDMPAQDYRRMLCVETAITGGRTLAPGQSHVLRQEIT